MSQEKVNKYKEEKANRKSILKKEKRIRILSRIGGTIVCLAIVGWIGYSAYTSITSKNAAAQTEINLAATQDYLSTLEADTAEE